MSKKYLIAFGISIFVMLIWGLGGYDLAAPDEPRFALVAREMMQNHHWVIPFRNDEIYSEKPPLFFWCISFCSFIVGEVNSFTARIPSALAAIGVLFMIFRWSKKETNSINIEIKGVITVFILLTTFLFFFEARMAQIDMVMCFFITGAMIEGFKLVSENGKSYLPMAIFMGLGTITKGPIAFLLPMGSCATYLILNKLKWQKIPWQAFLLSLIVPIIWLGFVLLEDPQNDPLNYLQIILYKQNIVRYANSWHHYQPFYYFFITFLHDFLPWTPFFLIALIFPLKNWKTISNKEKFSWCVCFFVLIFFSIPKGKRNIYILPMFPFAAYLVAHSIYCILKETIYPKVYKGFFGFLFILFLLAGIAFVGIGVMHFKVPDEYKLNIFIPYDKIVLLGFSLILISISGLMSIVKNTFKYSLIILILLMVEANIFIYQMAMPALDSQRSARGFMSQVIEITEKYEKNPVIGMVDFREGFRFYGNRHIVELDEAKGFGSKATFGIKKFWELYPKGWVIIKSTHWNEISRTKGINGTIRYEDTVGNQKTYYLIQQKAF